ncbi:DUF2017 family protein [Microbacterium gorillae]|uniref:DUF2017 family protein n=1 Tax=Microbacterium gorillae TaxID=1231063 RepID=UPI0005911493|nr:DUF2017 family protein [Microbacterium gorillae]
MPDEFRLTLSRMEVGGLADLVEQFTDLLRSGADDDPAVQRLTPNAYPDDDQAGREFHRLTAADLIARRVADAGVVADGLATAGIAGEPEDLVHIALDAAAIDSWMRTLSALRLIISSRLGVEDDGEHDPDDARFGVYDWLGYRLDGLVEATDDLLP